MCFVFIHTFFKFFLECRQSQNCFKSNTFNQRVFNELTIKEDTSY